PHPQRTQQRVSALVLLGNGRRALSGSWDNTLRLWDLATGGTMRTFEGHTSFVRAVAVLAEGCRALSGSWDNTLRLWDLATGQDLAHLRRAHQLGRRRGGAGRWPPRHLRLW